MPRGRPKKVKKLEKIKKKEVVKETPKNPFEYDPNNPYGR